MKIKYTIKEVKPQVFCVTFDTAYDMCMTFCRYQEYYESASPNIKGKDWISFFDVMKDYAFKYGNGAFTYAKDWAGFNLPDWVFKKLNPNLVLDFNDYDLEMIRILDKIKQKQSKKKVKPSNFYVIGVSKEVALQETMKHEIAHGLYYTNQDYRKQMDELIAKISPTNKLKFYKKLRTMNYADDVLDDEIQAYCATGLHDGMLFMKKTPGLLKKFSNCFRKFYDK